MHPKLHNITLSTATTDKKIISTCMDEPYIVSGGLSGGLTGLTVIVDDDSEGSTFDMGFAILKRRECIKIQYIYIHILKLAHARHGFMHKV